MNVLVLTNTWPSPSEVFIKNLVDGLIARNISVTVLCKKAKGPRADTRYGVLGCIRYFTSRTVIGTIISMLFIVPLFIIQRPASFVSLCIQCTMHHDFSVLLAPLAWYRVRKERFDVIHCQFGYLGNIGLVLQKAGLITGPIVSSFRGSDISSYLARKPSVYRVLKHRGDLFLPVCTAFRDRLVHLGFPEKKIRVYHSAIDLGDFPYTEPKPVSGECTTLFSAGRLVEKKGFTYAIDALSELLQKDSRFRLVIAGEGPLHDELRKKVTNDSISDKVVFTGWIDQNQLVDWLRQATFFLATNIESRTGDIDGIPNIVKEAMALGIPVIAFTHPGLEELITHRTTGMLVPSRDAKALVCAIEELTDINLVQKMCTAARRKIEQEYSKEAQAQYLEQLIQEFSEQ